VPSDSSPESDPFFEELWFPAPAALEHPSQLFHTPVYGRGAMTLQALREKVGDATFLEILRSWYSDNKYGNVSTGDFIDLAEQKSGPRPRCLLPNLALRGGPPRELVSHTMTG
jgi:aminopeptidase N